MVVVEQNYKISLPTLPFLCFLYLSFRDGVNSFEFGGFELNRTRMLAQAYNHRSKAVRAFAHLCVYMDDLLAFLFVGSH